MAQKRIIAVTGATGAQGGGLVRAILSDPSREFAVRAITRDPQSAKAKALADAGAELVAADLDDVASVQQAFSGAYGAFCVTFFWAHMSAETEVAQVRNMVRAAKHADLQHVVWSTLEDTRRWIPLDDNRMPTLHGSYKVPHFDGKGEADQLFREAGVPTTFLLTSFYWDNFIHFGAGPQRMPDGSLALVFPMADKKLPSMAADDIGKCALGIFRRDGEFIGKTVGIAGEHPTGAELAAGMSRATGQDIRYVDVPPDVYRGFGFPGADDLGNMFQFKRDFNEYFCGARSLEFSRSLNPELQTYEAWLAKHASRIPIP